jgi:hypothetical protein
MADWYVDASAGGTGAGTSPANAFVSITSVTWSHGDRAWVRKTHKETVNSVYVGPRSFANTSFSRWAFTIGWPSAGDPFYDERPAAGVSASWDSDVPSTLVYSVCGQKFPTFLSSGGGAPSAGMLLPRNGGLYNVAIQNTGGVTYPWASSDGSANERVLENVAILANSGGYFNAVSDPLRNATLGKIFLPSSASGVSGLIGQQVARHVVVPSLSQGYSVMRLSNAAPMAIGLLEIWSSSFSVLIDDNQLVSNMTEGEGQFHIGRVCGKRPNNGVTSLGRAATLLAQIDDYYGDGPMIVGGSYPNTRVASINEAACDVGSGASNALIYSVRSIAAVDQGYYVPIFQVPALRKYFNVVSGTAIEIRVPLYVDSTFIHSPAAGVNRAMLGCCGTVPVVSVKSNVLVGSPSQWTGSLIAAGSAWIWSCVFNPTETNSGVPFDVYLGQPLQTTSGQGLTGQMFVGEPYKV